MDPDPSLHKCLIRNIHFRTPDPDPNLKIQELIESFFIGYGSHSSEMIAADPIFHIF